MERISGLVGRSVVGCEFVVVAFLGFITVFESSLYFFWVVLWEDD